MREEVRTSAAGWIGEQLPGIFACDLADQQMPTWDLILTEGADLAINERTFEGWRAVLGYGFASLWRTPNAEGLAMIAPDGPGAWNASGATVTFAAERATVADPPEESLDDVAWRLMQRLDDLGSSLGWWAVEHCLLALERAIAEARERMSEAPRPWRGTSRRLERLRTQVLPATFDARMLAEAVKHLDAPAGISRASLITATGVAPSWPAGPPGANVAPHDFPDQMVDALRVTADRVAKDAQQASEGWRAFTDLILARSNLQLQRVVLMVSLVAAAASIAAVVIASTAGRGPG